MFNKTAPLELYTSEAKMCCWNSSWSHLCKSGWRQPGRGPAKVMFTFFIGWVLLLKGCSEACRTKSGCKSHIMVLTQSCSPATFIWGWRRKCDSSALLWDHGGLPRVCGTRLPGDDLHMTPPCRKPPLLGMKVSTWKGLSGQWLGHWWPNRGIFLTLGARCVNFPSFKERKMNEKQNETRIPAQIMWTGLQGVLQTTFCKIFLWYMSLP